MGLFEKTYKIKAATLEDPTFKVVDIVKNKILYQGNIIECDAYIRLLKDNRII